jgi:hypothetical protein
LLNGTVPFEAVEVKPAPRCVSCDELGESGDFLWLTASLHAKHPAYSDPRCGWHGKARAWVTRVLSIADRGELPTSDAVGQRSD